MRCCRGVRRAPRQCSPSAPTCASGRSATLRWTASPSAAAAPGTAPTATNTARWPISPPRPRSARAPNELARKPAPLHLDFRAVVSRGSTDPLGMGACACPQAFSACRAGRVLFLVSRIGWPPSFFFFFFFFFFSPPNPFRGGGRCHPQPGSRRLGPMKTPSVRRRRDVFLEHRGHPSGDLSSSIKLDFPIDRRQGHGALGVLFKTNRRRHFTEACVEDKAIDAILLGETSAPLPSPGCSGRRSGAFPGAVRDTDLDGAVFLSAGKGGCRPNRSSAASARWRSWSCAANRTFRSCRTL